MACWPCPGRQWEPSSCLVWPRCCARDYMFSENLQLDYRSVRKGDSTEMTAARTRLPCGVGRIGKSSGGSKAGRFRAFQAQRAPVPYNAPPRKPVVLTILHLHTSHSYSQVGSWSGSLLVCRPSQATFVSVCSFFSLCCPRLTLYYALSPFTFHLFELRRPSDITSPRTSPPWTFAYSSESEIELDYE